MTDEQKRLLDEVLTSELILELTLRFDDVVFYGRKIEDGGEHVDTFDWAGEPTLCKGLAMEIINIIDKYEDDEEIYS